MEDQLTLGKAWLANYSTYCVFRIIDDESEESEAEIALVVLKDGEKVSLGIGFDY